MTPPILEFYEDFLARLNALDDLSKAVRFGPRKKHLPLDATSGVVWMNGILNAIVDLGVEKSYRPFPERVYLGAGRDKNRPFLNNSKRSQTSEYLVDAAWTHYPEQTEWLTMLRSGRAPRPPRLILACETDATGSPLNIVGEFARLTDLRAPLKVLLFFFLDNSPTATFEGIVSLCSVAAAPVAPDEAYLFIGWPRRCDWRDRIERHRASFLPQELGAGRPTGG